MTNKNGCVGSYNVSGYTRSDGTSVSGYTRTCGAAHNSQNEESLLQDRANLLYPNTQIKHDDVPTGGAAKVDYNNQTIAGVERGEPMSIEEALKGTNPDYNIFGNPTYKNNCQSSVIVFDARLRGYDIEVDIPYESELKTKLSLRPNIAFIDPVTGKTPEFTKTKAKNETECINWLDQNIKQGQRYLFAFQWIRKDFDGKNKWHIITATKGKDNNIEFYDPQVGRNIGYNFLSRIKYKFDWTEESSPPEILRIDNKELNIKILNQISKPVKKSK